MNVVLLVLRVIVGGLFVGHGSQNRERRVDALRRQRQLLGSANERRWERRGSLKDHRLRRLNRDYLQIGRLV